MEPSFEKGRETSFPRRKATPNDIAFAREVHHAAFRHVIIRQFGNWKERVQDKMFEEALKDFSAYEIIQSGGADVGYCHIERAFDHMYLKELVIAPLYQNRGIGTKILLELIEEGKEKHIPVRLKVLKQNFAHDLYIKLGFKDIEEDGVHIHMEWNPTE